MYNEMQRQVRAEIVRRFGEEGRCGSVFSRPPTESCASTAAWFGSEPMTTITSMCSSGRTATDG
jgi:hypothetical protein